MYHHPEQLAFANCRYHSAVNMGFIVWESGQHFIARETNKTAPSFVLLPISGIKRKSFHEIKMPLHVLPSNRGRMRERRGEGYVSEELLLGPK